MFKASLIENSQYYELKKKLSILGLFSLIILQILSQFFAVTPFRFALYFCLVILIFYYFWLTQKDLKQVTSKKKLEMNNQSILIKGKSSELLEEIKLTEVEKIVLKNEYALQEENLKNSVKQLKGEVNQDYILLHTTNGQRRIDFTLDSHYMTEQLKKVIASWKEAGYPIKKENGLKSN